MLRDWEREHPGRIDRIFAAMSRVVPSHLMDRNLFAFDALQPSGVADPGGDHAFDDDGVDTDAGSSMLWPAGAPGDAPPGTAPALPGGDSP